VTSLVTGVSGPPHIDWPAKPAATSDTPAAAVPAKAVATAAPLPDLAERAREVARQLQEYLRQTGHHLQFTVDKATGMTIVRIYNSASGELVRQVPSEEIVHVAELLRQDSARLALSVKA